MRRQWPVAARGHARVMTKWIYILNYLQRPDEVGLADTDLRCVLNAKPFQLPGVLGSLGIEVQPVSVLMQVGWSVYDADKQQTRSGCSDLGARRLFAISIRGGERNDKLAQQVADAAVAALVLSNPNIGPEYPAALPVRLDKLGDRREVTFQQLLEDDVQRDPGERRGQFGLRVLLGTTYGVAPPTLEWIWDMVYAMLCDSYLFDAVHFYWASVREFSFTGDAIDEVLDDINATPGSKIALVRAENAALNAFKAIEALIGDLPNDDQRCGQKIQDIGLDPSDLVGWDVCPKRPLLEQLRGLSHLRDKRAAHARTMQDRRIAYFEMMNAQYLAEAFVLAYSEKVLSDSAQQA